MDGRAVSTGRCKTFIIGLRTAANTLIGFARETFISDPNIKHILSFKFSQEHIENLISKIRAKNGFNNNPDVVCFKAALKPLLVKSGIAQSPSANCNDITHDAENDSYLLTALPHKQQKTANHDEQEVDEDFSDDSYQETPTLSKPVQDISQYL